MSTHNICLHGEIRKILHLFGYPLLSGAMMIHSVSMDALESNNLYRICFTFVCIGQEIGSAVRGCVMTGVSDYHLIINDIVLLNYLFSRYRRAAFYSPY